MENNKAKEGVQLICLCCKTELPNELALPENKHLAKERGEMLVCDKCYEKYSDEEVLKIVHENWKDATKINNRFD